MRISDWSSDVCSSDLIGSLDQEADVADACFPPLAEQKVRVDAQFLRLFPVYAADAAGDAVALEVERLARAPVDQTRNAGFEQIGAARFIDVDTRDAARREILKRDRAALAGEEFAAMVGGGGVGQAANTRARKSAGEGRGV